MNENQLKNYFKNFKVSKKLLTFSFFIVLATIFWVLNALDKEYTTEIDFPVVFYNLPETKTPINEIPQKINVKITAYGYDIIGKVKSGNKFLRINFKKHAVRKNNKSDSNNYYILTDVLHKNINEKLGTNIKIINIYPDSLNFILANITSRKIPVKADIKTSYKQMFMQNGALQILPAEIKVSGFKKQIDTIKFIKTEFIEFKDLSDTLISEVRLMQIEGVRFTDKFVKIKVPVEKYTEKTLELPVNIKNLPDTLKMIIFPKNIKIRFKVALSSFNKITAEQFKANINYKKNTKKLKVSLEKSPNNINITTLYPEYLDYIIEKKEIEK